MNTHSNHNIETLREQLNQIHNFDKNSMNILLSKIEIRKYSKTDIIQEQNVPCDFVGFLISGNLIVKRIGEEGNELVVHFNTPEKTPFVGVFESLSKNEHSNTTIVSLDDSCIGFIEYLNLLELYAEHHSIETFGRKIMEKLYLSALEVSRFRQGTNTEKKLNEFNEQYPKIQDLCKQKDIANFLGVETSYFNRFLKKIRRN